MSSQCVYPTDLEFRKPRLQELPVASPGRRNLAALTTSAALAHHTAETAPITVRLALHPDRDAFAFEVKPNIIVQYRSSLSWVPQPNLSKYN